MRVFFFFFLLLLPELSGWEGGFIVLLGFSFQFVFFPLRLFTLISCGPGFFPFFSLSDCIYSFFLCVFVLGFLLFPSSFLAPTLYPFLQVFPFFHSSWVRYFFLQVFRSFDCFFFGREGGEDGFSFCEQAVCGDKGFLSWLPISKREEPGA